VQLKAGLEINYTSWAIRIISSWIGPGIMANFWIIGLELGYGLKL
jgi:hypothetical protein